MNMVDIICRKRDKKKLSAEEIRFFIHGITHREIPDYQAAALCMAVTLNGMDDEEITTLTMAIADSGKRLDLSDTVDFSVDKHSTGGVGDKTTLIVQPLAAACGLAVAKMAGRGLGFSGGTVDKLESIPGFRMSLTDEEFLELLRAHRMVISGQSKDLAPADGILYALRDVTGTVPSPALIASSIMGKKLTVSTNAILLDVKVGKGAFMKTFEDAKALARILVSIGKNCGRIIKAEISNMDQPLGYAVGNALEVKEAVSMLKNEPTAPDLYEHCIESTAQLLLMASKAANHEEALEKVVDALESGKGYEKLCELISIQGGDVSYLDDPEKFENAPVIQTFTAEKSGWIHEIDAEEVGHTCVELGGGRMKKTDPIDHRVGIILHHKVGDPITAGDPLFTIHAASEPTLTAAETRLKAAHLIKTDPCEKLPQFYGLVE